MVDCLLNAFPNMIYVTLAGGTHEHRSETFRATATGRGGAASATWANPSGRNAQTAALDPVTATSAATAGRITLADRYRNLGRSFKQEGRFDEAESAWRQALDLLIGVQDAKPNSREQRGCNGATAPTTWRGCGPITPDLARRDPDAAVAMARRIVEKCPDAEAYWNTLGVAYYRAGDDAMAVAALDGACPWRWNCIRRSFSGYGARTPWRPGKSPDGIRPRSGECGTGLPGPPRARGLLRRSPVNPHPRIRCSQRGPLTS